MAIQIIMDHNGDTRHSFDANDKQALLKAERRFKALTRDAYVRSGRRGDFVLPAARGRITVSVQS